MMPPSARDASSARLLFPCFIFTPQSSQEPIPGPAHLYLPGSPVFLFYSSLSIVPEGFKHCFLTFFTLPFTKILISKDRNPICSSPGHLGDRCAGRPRKEMYSVCRYGKRAEGPGNTSRPSPPLQPWHEVSV